MNLRQTITAPLILYGAGECSHWFCEIVMKRQGIRPVAVLDRKFRHGDTWHGIPAHSPEDYPPNSEAIVVISVGNLIVLDEIRTELLHRGFRNIVSLHDIYEIHNPFEQPNIPSSQWRDFFDRHRERIAAAFDLLADDESREVFSAFIQTHEDRRPVVIPQRPREEQYFPKDVPLSKGHARYVCCGAYDGDSLRTLNKMFGKVEAIVCFEPEAHIYSRLTDYLRREGRQLADHILTWPCAVHVSTMLRRFLPGDGLGSRLSEDGSTWVQCVSLDDALRSFNPTFISMDIEGAEPDALRGAEYLLRHAQPDLGICLYHSPAHAWEIPLYLDSLNLGYKFYIRNYTGFAIETVLYATGGAYDSKQPQ